MSVEINIQFILKNRARIQASIDAFVDECWDPMLMGLSDDEIKKISSGDELLKVLYACCFPNADVEHLSDDEDFNVHDADYKPFTDQIRAIRDFS